MSRVPKGLLLCAVLLKGHARGMEVPWDTENGAYFHDTALGVIYSLIQDPGALLYLEDRRCQIDKPRWQNWCHADSYEVWQQLSLLSSHSPAEARYASGKQTHNYILHTIILTLNISLRLLWDQRGSAGTHMGRISSSVRYRASALQAQQVPRGCAVLLKSTLSSSLDSQKLPLDPTVLATAMNGTATGVPYKLPASTFMKDDPGTINTCSRTRSACACILSSDIYYCSGHALEG